MQKVFRNDASGKLEFKEYLIEACEELVDEERNPGSSLVAKTSINWLENESNLENLWEWFNSEEYEKMCEEWYLYYGETVEISGIGRWKIDFVLESGALIISDNNRKLVYWLWMVPDWNEF